MKNQISTLIHQWCPRCLAATLSVPCQLCGPPAQTCAECGHHPGCYGPEDDD
jgi:hypothetical protein